MIFNRFAATVCAVAFVLPSTQVFSASTKIPALVEEPTGQWIPGEFLWSDLFSSEPAASVGFYSAVFGWTAESFGSGDEAYVVLSSGDEAVAGVVQGPTVSEGERGARWVSYVSVENVAASADKVTAAGGSVVMAPIDIPNRGVHAIVSDPEGALFGLLKTASGDPKDFLADVNDWVWISVFSNNSKAMVGFYEDVIGYESHDDVRSEAGGDYILSSNDHARAGVASLPDDTEYKPEWVGFVRVENLEATTVSVEQNGGRLLGETVETERGNKIAYAADPLGGIFGLAEISKETEEDGK